MAGRQLEDKRALVTGASRGLGQAIARSLGAHGARVAFTYTRDEPGAARTLDALRESGAESRAFPVSVLDSAGTDAMVRELEQAWGGLDVLVNNAGVLKFARIADMPLADFRQVLEVNAVGCWLGMKAVIGPMTAAGGGSIVNISSIEGFTGAAGLSAYSASKFAIRGMTKAAARELGRFGIRVNSVHPGGVLTSMTLGAAGAADDIDPDAFVKSMPLSRFAEPVEISRLVAYLASDDSSYSTGSEFIADGGVLSGPGY
jgi:3alpha(or 20beta)-hydroxysteroid dehydrogenase